MKKSLIALAVGAAFAAPAAYADVTISGAINMGLAYNHQGGGTSQASNSLVNITAPQGGGVSRTGIDTNYSNITIGSLEDLGGGLKLDFAFQIVAPLQQNGSLVNRDSHIGLVSDSWGGVWYGTNENLYERYLYSVDPLDGAAGMGGNLQVLGSPGFGTVFDAPTNNPANCTNVNGNNVNVGCAGFYRRTENTLWYDSPNWGGFTFGLYTTLQAYKQGNPVASPGVGTGRTPPNPWVYGLGGKYVGPQIPIQAWLAYERHKDLYGINAITSGMGLGTGGNGTGTTGTSSSDYAVQLGAGYTFGDVFVYINYEKLKYTEDGLTGTALNGYKRAAESIGLKWNLATGYVGAQFDAAQNGSCSLADGTACDAGGTTGKMFAVGYYATLSKQTQAYVVGNYIKNGNLQSYLPAGGGTAAGPNLGVSLGANIWGATVGLKHTF